MRSSVAASLALVLAAVVQNGLVALGVLSLGVEPQGESRFHWIVAVAFPALLACGLLFLIGSAARRVGEPLAGWTPAVLFPAAGALWVIAGFFSYDPYYQPTLKRYSEEATFSGWWIAVVVVLCALACLAVRRAGRAGLALGGVALLMCVLAPLSVGWH